MKICDQCAEYVSDHGNHVCCPPELSARGERLARERVARLLDRRADAFPDEPLVHAVLRSLAAELREASKP